MVDAIHPAAHPVATTDVDPVAAIMAAIPVAAADAGAVNNFYFWQPPVKRTTIFG